MLTENIGYLLKDHDCFVNVYPTLVIKLFHAVCNFLHYLHQTFTSRAVTDCCTNSTVRVNVREDDKLIVSHI